MLGGKCTLHACTLGEQCPPEQECVEHSVCLEAYEDEYYLWNEVPTEQGELDPPAPSDTRPSLLRSPSLIAGPPAPRVKRPKPIVRYNAVNLCAKGVACGAPHTCQSEKLCVPRGKRAAAYLGTNIEPAAVARTTDTPLTASGAQPTESAAPPAPKKAGCAGCSVQPLEDAPPAMLAITAAFFFALSRRRSRALPAEQESTTHVLGRRPGVPAVTVGARTSTRPRRQR
jgi:hypothetical protein